MFDVENLTCDDCSSIHGSSYCSKKGYALDSKSICSDFTPGKSLIDKTVSKLNNPELLSGKEKELLSQATQIVNQMMK